ncbi:hypothetical protein SAMN02910353_00391 [Ruminococcus sp. YRD2003]|uniref:hypothetical protein n=1 Tax=Ruminococcus sp. YRD2003 TaxID=1452313 RepID=UPI0008BA0EF7|nr:hypothetical protein SAMN02910353_00391 [Ruminococcus flavefaciens]
MDRYEEKAKSIMARGDVIIAERKRRRTSLIRTFAIGTGAAAVIGIGICANALKPPQKPVPEQSNTVIETNKKYAAEYNSVSNNTLLTAPSTTVAVTTTTIIKTETTLTSVTTTTFSNETTSTSMQTTTQTDAVSMQTTQTTTAAQPAVTMPSDMTYLDLVAANVKNLDLFDGNQYQLWQYYYFPSDRRTSSSPKTKSIADEDIGELLTEISVEPTEYTELLPETLNADVYQIGSISGDYAVAIRFEGTDLNLIYHNLDYKPASLEQFAEDLDVQNNLKVEFVNDNNHPNIRPRPANKDDAFAILFAEKDENAKAGPGASDPPVWLGATVIPIPEDFLSFEVRVNGYLYITTPTNKKLSFLIGKDRAKEFIKFVENQY